MTDTPPRKPAFEVIAENYKKLVEISQSEAPLKNRRWITRLINEMREALVGIGYDAALRDMKKAIEYSDFPGNVGDTTAYVMRYPLGFAKAIDALGFKDWLTEDEQRFLRHKDPLPNVLVRLIAPQQQPGDGLSRAG